MEIPQSAANDIFKATITDIQIGTQAETLGTTQNGTTTMPVQAEQGNTAHLRTFNPSFSWTTVSNGGYTVAVSQSLQNQSIQQNAISSSNYIEQVEYQGSFRLPSAPDLSYGLTQLTEKFNISTSQVSVLDINGVSYVNEISGKNGTIVLLSSVNPTSQTQFLQIVDYSSSQWEKVSGPPGFFTMNGILYYFDELVLGIISVVGIGGGTAAVRARSLRRVK